ncbi:hypothetical protein XELAEV_18010953mg [Xenopus laevis]|uniref:Uncharacterized protein n=1 Tax=Xenopus laevis TaxID=8355 RepID=A0A974DVS2_XENLA|nr:hypothetical protein XELAEV_18010953mg [Xenopus laevis]
MLQVGPSPVYWNNPVMLLHGAFESWLLCATLSYILVLFRALDVVHSSTFKLTVSDFPHGCACSCGEFGEAVSGVLTGTSKYLGDIRYPFPNLCISVTLSSTMEFSLGFMFTALL